MGTVNRAATVTIASGQTVSNGIDIGDQQIVGVITPATLTGVAITFQGSHDGITYKAVTKEDGTNYSITVAASRYVMIPPTALPGVRFVKLVSGAVEGAARDIIVMLRSYA